MIRNILQSIEGVGIYPVITLVIFFLFFTGLIVWVIRADKGYIKIMEQLPLEGSTKSNTNFTGERDEK